MNPVIFLALRLFEPIEPVNEPSVGRQDVSVRDDVRELAAITKNTDKKIMLASLGAG